MFVVQQCTIVYVVVQQCKIIYACSTPMYDNICLYYNNI